MVPPGCRRASARGYRHAARGHGLSPSIRSANRPPGWGPHSQSFVIAASWSIASWRMRSPWAAAAASVLSGVPPSARSPMPPSSLLPHLPSPPAAPGPVSAAVSGCPPARRAPTAAPAADAPGMPAPRPVARPRTGRWPARSRRSLRNQHGEVLDGASDNGVGRGEVAGADALSVAGGELDDALPLDRRAVGNAPGIDPAFLPGQRHLTAHQRRVAEQLVEECQRTGVTGLPRRPVPMTINRIQGTDVRVL